MPGDTFDILGKAKASYDRREAVTIEVPEWELTFAVCRPSVDQYAEEIRLLSAGYADFIRGAPALIVARARGTDGRPMFRELHIAELQTNCDPRVVARVAQEILKADREVFGVLAKVDDQVDAAKND